MPNEILVYDILNNVKEHCQRQSSKKYMYDNSGCGYCPIKQLCDIICPCDNPCDWELEEPK